MPKIAPSLLSADFCRLGEEVKRLEDAGADMVHIDVMDGRFVPNITIGDGVVSAIRQCTSLPFDLHLMVVEPERFLRAFASAGADIITMHLESLQNPVGALEGIRSLGKHAGLAVNPDTPIQRAFPFLGSVDLLLVMSVFPGFPGQKFIPEVLEKVSAVRAERERAGLGFEIAVDGGVTIENAGSAASAGADILVAGSAVFRDPRGVKHAIDAIRKAALEPHAVSG
ncbi:MAG: ribulose-phosphate 3-epimerase [Candidatus Thermoplasmatota archaeon]